MALGRRQIMGKKKEFWELADSTILGRTKKAELLQIARGEHGQTETYRAQLNSQAGQIDAQKDVIEQLRAQLKEGTVRSPELKELMWKLDEQQHNHEQELSQLQEQARNWEKVAQDYKDVIVSQQTEISYLSSVVQNIKQFARMSPKEAGQAFVDWLLGPQDKEING